MAVIAPLVAPTLSLPKPSRTDEPTQTPNCTSTLHNTHWGKNAVDRDSFREAAVEFAGRVVMTLGSPVSSFYWETTCDGKTVEEPVGDSIDWGLKYL